MQCEQTLITYEYRIIQKNCLHIWTPREISNKKISKFKLFEGIFCKKWTYKDDGNIFKIPVFLKALYCEILFAGFCRSGHIFQWRNFSIFKHCCLPERQYQTGSYGNTWCTKFGNFSIPQNKTDTASLSYYHSYWYTMSPFRSTVNEEPLQVTVGNT